MLRRYISKGVFMERYTFEELKGFTDEIMTIPTSI
jgi:hypothetical protein